MRISDWSSDVCSSDLVMVIPLQVVIGANSYDEGIDEGAHPEMVAAALKAFTPVSTSRPSPAVMLEVYEKLAAEGVTEFVSVHLSGAISGTFASAPVASGQASIPVHTAARRGGGPAPGDG